LTEPLGITLAAQLGVAPVLLVTFGPVPVASLPANLLAVPVAGLVMVWGLTAGMVAGIVGGGIAEVVHLPTRVLLGWIEAVAERAAAAPLGELRAPHLAAIALGLGITAMARDHGGVVLRRGGLAAAGAAIAAAVLVAHVPPPLRSVPRSGVVRWHAGNTDVVALGGGGWRASLGVASVLEELRRAGVGGIDLLVVVDDGVPGSVVEAVTTRHPTGPVLVPSHGDAPVGAVPIPAGGTELDIGGLHVTIVPGEDRLVVEARPRG
jgi:competence protein ComEC